MTTLPALTTTKNRESVPEGGVLAHGDAVPPKQTDTLMGKVSAFLEQGVSKMIRRAHQGRSKLPNLRWLTNRVPQRCSRSGMVGQR